MIPEKSVNWTLSDGKVAVPIIRLSYPKKVNPNVFEALKLYSKWLDEKISIKKFMGTDMRDSCISMSYCFPECTTRELLAISQALSLSVLCDDKFLEMFENQEEANQFVEDAIQIGETNDHEKAKSFNMFGALIMETINSNLNYFSKLHNKPEEYLEFQKKRATNTLRECFEAIGKENRIRTEGVSFEEFELIRQKTMGSELVSDCDVRKILNDQLFEHHQNEFNILNATINDIYSFNREQKQGDKCNLVYQIMLTNNLSAQKAIDKATIYFYGHLYEWEQSVKKILDKFLSVKNLDKYFECLKNVTMGNLVGNLYASRYAIDNNILSIL